MHTQECLENLPFHSSHLVPETLRHILSHLIQPAVLTYKHCPSYHTHTQVICTAPFLSSHCTLVSFPPASLGSARGVDSSTVELQQALPGASPASQWELAACVHHHPLGSSWQLSGHTLCRWCLGLSLCICCGQITSFSIQKAWGRLLASHTFCPFLCFLRSSESLSRCSITYC